MAAVPASRVNTAVAPTSMAVAAPTTLEVSRFMGMPDLEQERKCYESFYHTTAVHQFNVLVCAVCAWEAFEEQDGVMSFWIEHIPNSYRLYPQQSHFSYIYKSKEFWEREGSNWRGVKEKEKWDKLSQLSFGRETEFLNRTPKSMPPHVSKVTSDKVSASLFKF